MMASAARPSARIPGKRYGGAHSSGGGTAGRGAPFGVARRAFVRAIQFASLAAVGFAPIAHASSGGLTITTGSPLPDGTQGVAYSASLAATGGTAPYTWSVTSGQLPAGLALDASNGSITGLPSAVESQTFIVTATDADLNTATAEFSLRVLAPLEITTATLPGGTAGTPYDQLVEASGGATPYAWSVSAGALPAGLVLDPATGRVSGTPASASANSFELEVTDADGHTATHAFDVPVAEPPQITTTSLPGSTAGTAYSQTLASSGGTAPLSWSVIDGTLPPGISLAGATGILSGTPTVVGTSTFTVQLADAAGALTSHAFDLTVSSGTAAALAFVQQPANTPIRTVLTPAVTVRVTDALTNPVSGVAVTLDLEGGPSLGGGVTATSNAQGIATFATLTVDSPGSGLHLSATAGALGPVLSAPFDATCPAIAVSPDTLAVGSVGVAYAQTIGAAGGIAPYAFAVTSGTLPPGLALVAATGALSGTPTASGTFAITITATDSVGCSGARAYSLQVLPVPAAITDLASSQSLTGNDTSGRLRLAIAFTPPAGASAIQVYRAPFGHYPAYDDAGGSVPAIPGYPPAAPWTLTPVTGSGQVDVPATRDVWFYVAFWRNALGVWSPVSNLTAGTPNYLLGDVSDGLTAGAGNNRVWNEDISLLGAHYGIGAAQIAAQGVGYLDVGPTVDLSPSSRPFTDGQINFEDLIVFASNYGTPTASPSLAAHRAGSGGSERFTVSAPSLVEAGQEFDVPLTLSGAGSLQGFSARLAWDPAVVVPEQMHSLGFIEGQGGVVLSGSPGMIDAALLGTRASGIAGDGEVARVHFRALRAGIAAIELKSVDGRDAANHHVSALELKSEQRLPTETVLLAPAPNPTSGRAELAYTLARSGEVELAIYAVDGRRVRTLASGQRPAGIYRLSWDARDGQGRSLPAGMYFLRLDAAGRRCSRSIALVR